MRRAVYTASTVLFDGQEKWNRHADEGWRKAQSDFLAACQKSVFVNERSTSQSMEPVKEINILLVDDTPAKLVALESTLADLGAI